MKYSRLLVYEIKNEKYLKRIAITKGNKEFKKNSKYLILTATPYIKKGFLNFEDRLKYFFENIFNYCVKNKFKSIDKIGVIIECHEQFNIYDFEKSKYSIIENNLFSTLENVRLKKLIRIFTYLLPLLIISGFLLLSYFAILRSL